MIGFDRCGRVCQVPWSGLVSLPSMVDLVSPSFCDSILRFLYRRFFVFSRALFHRSLWLPADARWEGFLFSRVIFIPPGVAVVVNTSVHRG